MLFHHYIILLLIIFLNNLPLFSRTTEDLLHLQHV
nr:MAG TPA: hypothetical protein [Caudoviricetes sp.]